MAKTVEDISTLKINILSQAQYEAEVAGGTVAENELYFTPSLGSGVSDVEVDGESVVSGGVAQIIMPVVPEKVSDLINDLGFLTSETDPTVPAWAKVPVKPSYNFSEINSTPTTLSGYGITDAKISNGTIMLGNSTITPLTSYTETDPTVPSWAKQSSKPTYTALEVGALPNTTVIPAKTSDLTNDSYFVSDANYVHTDNNFTTTEKNKLSGIQSGAEVNVQANWNQSDSTADDYIKNKPTIPTLPSPSSTTPVMDGTASVGSETNYARGDHRHPADTSKQDTLVSGTNIKTINGNSILGSGDLSILNMFYPVGSIYQTIDDGFNPNIRWGGTWELIEEGRFLQATETSATGGDTVSAGLPNFGGYLDIRATDYNASPVAWADGVFIKSTTAGYSVDAVHQQNGAANVMRYNFDAHYYNSIYGNSTTVQPPSIKVYMWHRTA